MDTLYWATEYVKVFLAYFAIMFVWPSVMFHNYLKDKSRTVRFAFCVTVPVVLINTVVLGLGLLHILHGWLVALLFYGSLLWGIVRRIKLSQAQKKAIVRFLKGTYGIRLFFSDIHRYLKNWCGEKRKQHRKSMRGHWIEYITLAAVVVFGMIYFGYGAFQNVCYGTSDMPVHHSWIYGLEQGKIFSSGIYPEGMHCFIYVLHIVFGIRVYSCELFLAGIYISVFLVSVYLFLRELFTWRGSAILALALFLTVDIKNADMIASIARLQWTIPQEFGLYTQFLCALFLLRCLNDPFDKKQKGWKNFLKYQYKNENLLLFLMAFTASFVIHFYVTIMAFYLCLAIVIVKFVSLFRKKRILYLAGATMIGLFISIAPMAVAYLEGNPLQGSLNWAMGVMQGQKQNSTENNMENTEIESENTQNQVVKSTESDQEKAYVAVKQKSEERNFEILLQKVKTKVIEKASILYENSLVILYMKERAKWIVELCILGFGMWFVYRLIVGVLALFVKTKKVRRYFLHRMDGNLILLMMVIIFAAAYASSALGLPNLIENVRLGSTIQILICGAVFVPIDIVLALLAETVLRYVIFFMLPFGVGGIYAGTQYAGVFHGYLFYNLSRYNSTVDITNDIMEKFPENSYTIVSPTEELYQVIENGWHEEAMVFLQKVQTEKNFTIPTQYIFVYVEKKPIEFMQYHFFTGPAWLADEKYQPFFGVFSSQGNQINAGKVSTQAAKEPIQIYTLLSDTYAKLDSRIIVESRLYEWCKKFQEKFPEEMKIYYENDRFCCYKITQNPYRLFQLEEK